MSHNQNSYDVLINSTKNTPDWTSLKFGPFDEFPVLIFGTLERFKINAKYLEGCNYYGRARTFNYNFVAKQPPSNGFMQISDPFIFSNAGVSNVMIEKEGLGPIFKQSEVLSLEGDLYGVPLRMLANLDTHYQNKDGTERIQCWCRLIDRSQEGASVNAYLWVVDLDFFLDIYDPSINLRDCNKVEYSNQSTEKRTKSYIF